MKRTACLLTATALLAALGGCGTSSGPAVSLDDARAEAAYEQLVQAYSARVWDELGDEVLRLDQQQALQRASVIARSTFAGHLDVIRRYGLVRLRSLPRAERSDPSQWTVVSDGDGDMSGLRAEMDRIYAPHVTMLPDRMADLMAHPLLLRNLSMEQFGRLAMLQSVAPLQPRVIDPDPRRPILQVERGPYRAEITLEPDADGAYWPVEARSLRRAGAAGGG